MERRGRTVLLLERGVGSKKIVKLALEEAGYTVFEVFNGLRLVSRLHVDRPDVVVLDTDQSWTDCFDLCHSLKNSDRFGQVRVVLLTGDDQRERARLACCDRLVDRTHGTGDLLAALGELFEGGNQAVLP